MPLNQRVDRIGAIGVRVPAPSGVVAAAQGIAVLQREAAVIAAPLA